MLNKGHEFSVIKRTHLPDFWAVLSLHVWLDLTVTAFQRCMYVIGHHPVHPKTHGLCQIFSVVKIWHVCDAPPGMLCYQSMVLGKHLLCRGKAIGTQINLTNPTANRAACQVKMEQIHLHSFEAFLTQIWNEATNAKLEKLIICK